MDEYFVEEKSNWDKILDFLVFIAVFAVTIFLVLELIASSGSTNINLENCVTRHHISFKNINCHI